MDRPARLSFDDTRTMSTTTSDAVYTADQGQITWRRALLTILAVGAIVGTGAMLRDDRNP